MSRPYESVHGLASTGFVYTNPLVGVEPQTPGGVDNG